MKATCMQARVRLYTLTERPKDGSTCQYYLRGPQNILHSCNLEAHFPQVYLVFISIYY